jgi:HD domain-containing protein
MVRMSDVVRGSASPAETAPDAAEPSAHPAEAPPSEPPARRLSLRPGAGAAPPATPEAPVAPVAPAGAAEPATPPAGPVDARAAHELFASLVGFLEGLRPLVGNADPFPWPGLRRLLERVVGSLAQSGELFWIANEPMAPAGVDPLAFHQARVAVLALRIGASVGLPPDELIHLGLAASLIDVAFWLAPSGVTGIDPASAAYREHPAVSGELVRRWAPPNASVIDAVLAHHELEHGQGFPHGLRKDAIHPHAKVLGLVDRYATLTGSGPSRTRGRAHEVIRDIVRSKSDEFAPALVKALLTEISIFPPGTPVRLNTNELGRVVGVNRNHPLRPRVAIVEDAKGRSADPPRLVDLSETPFLYITGPAESR